MKFEDVQSEYDKNKKLRKEDILMLQEWVKKQPHLPQISELYLILFLHSCYYSIELAKTTIDKFFTYRAHWTEVFTKRNPNSAHIRKNLDVAAFIHLPKKTPDNYQIIVGKFLNCDPELYNFVDQIQIFDICVMHWLMGKGTAEGLIIVMDLEGVTFSHILKLGVMTMKKLLTYLQEAMPVRLKAIHFTNVKSFVDLLLPLMKPFLKKDLLNALHFHTESAQNIFKYIPQDCFQKDYGGSAPSFIDLWEDKKKALFESEDYFREDEALTSNESKRVSKAAYVDDVFGIEGSFKKLDID